MKEEYKIHVFLGIATVIMSVAPVIYNLLEISEENMGLCSGIGFTVLVMAFGMAEERRQEKEREEYEKRRNWWRQDERYSPKSSDNET